MISIVSGPTCVGKTYFIDNKKDRLLELNNLPPTTESYVTGSINTNHLEFRDVVSHWIKRYDGRDIVDQIVSIHYNLVTGVHRSRLINAYKNNDDYFSKNVIILGVSYSEYKVRIGQRHGSLSIPTGNRSQRLLDVYKDWINDLNKNEIPYKFVEAIGDYKVLEEEEFFRMLND